MRMFAVILLCLLLGGCSAVVAGPVETTTVQQDYFWESQCLAQTQECALWLEGCTRDDSGNFILNILCRNMSESAQLFTVERLVVSGWQVMSFWGEEVPGSTQQRFDLTIPASVLQTSGIQTPQSLAFDLRIFTLKDLNQTYLVSHPCRVYPEGLVPAQVQVPKWEPSENDRVLADNKGCTFTVRSCRQEQGQFIMECYLENKTRQPLSFRAHHVTLNGMDLDTVWFVQLSPGARHMAAIELPIVPTVGIVRQAELSLHICRSDTWFGEVWAQERFALSIDLPK